MTKKVQSLLKQLSDIKDNQNVDIVCWVDRVYVTSIKHSDDPNAVVLTINFIADPNVPLKFTNKALNQSLVTSEYILLRDTNDIQRSISWKKTIQCEVVNDWD